MESDGLLLQRYAASRDADAFAELARRHAGLVYGTALRITRSPADAEDVAQECFLSLARSGGSVATSLAGWLHASATHRALMSLRSNRRRQRYEGQVPMPKNDPAEPSWDEIAPQVDAALAELDEDMRQPILLRFFQGRTQVQIAEELNISQSTVSSRLEKGIDALRSRLRRAGVVTSVAVLTSILSANASAAAPAALEAALAKMALAGVGGGAVAAGAGAGAAKLVLVLALVISLGGAVAAYWLGSRRPMNSPNVRPVATTQARQDLSRLQLRCDPSRQDSFSVTMQAVARLLGRDADYRTVYALSTNGFAPDICFDEPCRSTWRQLGRGQCIGLVSEYLGLRVAPVAFPLEAPRPPADAQGRTWGTPAYNQWLAERNRTCAAVVRKVLDSGAVVVTDGGWVKDYHLWGVITDVGDDGRVPGISADGNTGNSLDHFRSCWAITRADTSLPQSEADPRMLAQAVARIRGQNGSFAPGKLVFGLPAMDLWIAQMGKPVFEEGDPGSSVPNAMACARFSYDGSRETAAYLRGRAAQLPAGTRTHLEKAADQYERIARLLAPFTIDPGEFVSAGETIAVNGHTYRLEWVTPKRLAELKLVGADHLRPRSPDDPYAMDTGPLYNIHCEIGPDVADAEIDRSLKQSGKSWSDHWANLAANLPADEPFALLAVADGKTAGYIRFFPADRAHLRVPLAKRQSRKDVLLIGAGRTDLAGAQDGLEAELVQRVVAFARQKGFASVQAVGWSEVAPYAMWAEALPGSVYQSLGFARGDHLGGDPAAFKDMRSGAHGPAVQKLVKEAVDAGLLPAAADDVNLVALDLPASDYRTVLGDAGRQKAHIDNVLRPAKACLAAAADEMAQALAGMYPPAAQLDMASPPSTSGNTYARGLSAVLTHSGTPADYNRLMGLSGVAFILQVDTSGPISDGHLDAAWWPNDAWGFELGLPLLSRATGWEIRKIGCDDKGYQTDAPAEYARCFSGAVKESIAAGKPVLAQYDACFIITGYDEKAPPVLGYGPPPKSTSFARAVGRIRDYPCGLFVIGGKTDPLDAKAADLAALRHAIAIASDKALGPGATPTRFSGQKAWAAWIKLLREGAEPSQDVWDRNMIIHLRYNRSAAVRFLREMADRYAAPVSDHLAAAADLYQQVLDECRAPEFPPQPDALKHYTAMVERMAALERKAMSELRQAADAMVAVAPATRPTTAP